MVKESQKKQNKVMRISFFLLTLISLIMVVMVVIKTTIGYSSPTGIVQYNPTIYLAWNNGSIANETYFNKTSGLVQHANFLRGLDDIKYVFGIGAKVGLNINLITFDELPGNVTISTDNLTYWRASSHMNRTIGNEWYYIRKENGQRINDDYVKMKYIISVSTSGSRTYYLATGIRQMDMDNDGIYEKISLVNETDVILWDNRTGSRTFANISRITIDSGRYTFDINFAAPVSAVYNHTSKSTNGDWIFYQEIGKINSSTYYDFEYSWIDAECVITCAGSCNLVINSNATGGNQLQLRKWANVGCKIQNALSCGVTGSCGYSSSCFIQWLHDYPELDEMSWHPITRSTNESPLECGSTWCNKSNPTKGTYYYSDLNGSKSSYPSGIYTHFTCGMWLTSTNSWMTSYDFLGFTSLYNVSPIEINITLGNPQNPWLLNNTINWAVFMINQSRANVTKYDNISLVLNKTINTTSAPNLTANVTFTSNGIWNWTGIACFRYNCQYAWNGNKSISQQSIPAIISLINRIMRSVLIDRGF